MADDATHVCEHDWRADRFGDCNAFDIQSWQWQCSRCLHREPMRPPGSDPEIARLRSQLATAEAQRDARIDPTADRSVMVALSKVLFPGSLKHPSFDSSWLLTELECALDCCEDDCNARASIKYCDKHHGEALDFVARLTRLQALDEAAGICNRQSDALREYPRSRTAYEVAHVTDNLASLIRGLAGKATHLAKEPPPLDHSGSGIHRIPRSETTRVDIHPAEQQPPSCPRCGGSRQLQNPHRLYGEGPTYPCPFCASSSAKEPT